MCIDCNLMTQEVTCPNCGKGYCYRDWKERRKAFENKEFNDWMPLSDWCRRCGR